MSRLYIISFLVILHLSALAQTVPDKNVSDEFNKILLQLENKINTVEPGNQYVLRSFNFTIDKIRKNEVSVVYNDKLNYGITDCASASIIEGGHISFSFGNFLVEAYKAFPILVEGIIVHEFQHIYDFHINPELVEISKNNPIEKSYFEIDALTIEGIYFNTYRTDYDSTSRLENFFLSDMNSGFWSVIAVFERVDLQLLHKIDEVEKNKKNSELAKQEFIKIGRELLTSFQLEEDQWSNYCNLVALRTFSYYSRQVLYDILFVLDGIDLSDEELNLSDYPEFNEIVNNTLDVIEQNESFFNDYKNQVVKSFNDEVLNRIEKK